MLFFNQKSKPCSWRDDSDDTEAYTFSLLLGSSLNFLSLEVTCHSYRFFCVLQEFSVHAHTCYSDGTG